MTTLWFNPNMPPSLSWIVKHILNVIKESCSLCLLLQPKIQSTEIAISTFPNLISVWLGQRWKIWKRQEHMYFWNFSKNGRRIRVWSKNFSVGRIWELGEDRRQNSWFRKIVQGSFNKTTTSKKTAALTKNCQQWWLKQCLSALQVISSSFKNNLNL